MTYLRGVTIDGECLGNNVVIDSMFRALCTISPLIVKEFLLKLKTAGNLGRKVKITEFGYIDENSLHIDFQNKYLEGSCLLKLQHRAGKICNVHGEIAVDRFGQRYEKNAETMKTESVSKEVKPLDEISGENQIQNEFIPEKQNLGGEEISGEDRSNEDRSNIVDLRSKFAGEDNAFNETNTADEEIAFVSSEQTEPELSGMNAENGADGITDFNSDVTEENHFANGELPHIENKKNTNIQTEPETDISAEAEIKNTETNIEKTELEPVVKTEDTENNGTQPLPEILKSNASENKTEVEIKSKEGTSATIIADKISIHCSGNIETDGNKPQTPAYTNSELSGNNTGKNMQAFPTGQNQSLSNGMQNGRGFQQSGMGQGFPNGMQNGRGFQQAGMGQGFPNGMQNGGGFQQSGMGQGFPNGMQNGGGFQQAGMSRGFSNSMQSGSPLSGGNRGSEKLSALNKQDKSIGKDKISKPEEKIEKKEDKVEKEALNTTVESKKEPEKTIPEIPEEKKEPEKAPKKRTPMYDENTNDEEIEETLSDFYTAFQQPEKEDDSINGRVSNSHDDETFEINKNTNLEDILHYYYDKKKPALTDYHPELRIFNSKMRENASIISDNLFVAGNRLYKWADTLYLEE